MEALGIIDAIGLSTATMALDAACKAAEVRLVGVERIISVMGKIGVTVQIAGEVAAVRAAVDAGVEAGNRVGVVVASHVIPRPHDEMKKLLEKFEKNLTNTEKKQEVASEKSEKQTLKEPGTEVPQTNK